MTYQAFKLPVFYRFVEASEALNLVFVALFVVDKLLLAAITLVKLCRQEILTQLSNRTLLQ